MYEEENYKAANLPAIDKYFEHIYFGKAKFQKRSFNLCEIHHLWTFL